MPSEDLYFDRTVQEGFMSPILEEDELKSSQNYVSKGKEKGKEIMASGRKLKLHILTDTCLTIF